MFTLRIEHGRRGRWRGNILWDFLSSLVTLVSYLCNCVTIICYFVLSLILRTGVGTPNSLALTLTRGVLGFGLSEEIISYMKQASASQERQTTSDMCGLETEHHMHFVSMCSSPNKHGHMFTIDSFPGILIKIFYFFLPHLDRHLTCEIRSSRMFYVPYWIVGSREKTGSEGRKSDEGCCST